METVTSADFEEAWRINALGLFLTARCVIPAMTAAGRGAIVVVGATASLRGMAGTAAFASAKAAQRSLAQSLARHLWPKGVHVSLIIIDGVVGGGGGHAGEVSRTARGLLRQARCGRRHRAGSRAARPFGVELRGGGASLRRELVIVRAPWTASVAAVGHDVLDRAGLAVLLSILLFATVGAASTARYFCGGVGKINFLDQDEVAISRRQSA